MRWITFTRIGLMCAALGSVGSFVSAQQPGGWNASKCSAGSPCQKSECQQCKRPKNLFESRYIKEHCQPTIAPGSCFGYFQSRWNSWDAACPNWQAGGATAVPVAAISTKPTTTKSPEPEPTLEPKRESAPIPRVTKPSEEMPLPRPLPPVPVPPPAPIPPLPNPETQLPPLPSISPSTGVPLPSIPVAPAVIVPTSTTVKPPESAAPNPPTIAVPPLPDTNLTPWPPVPEIRLNPEQK